MEATSPDIIIGTETWLHSDINSSEFLNPSLGYDIHRNDRASDPHGGVLIALKQNMEFTNVTKSKTVELISGTLNLPKGKKMIIAAYYRPPNRTDDKYLTDTYNEIMSLKQQHKKATFILSGDFNIPDICWSTNTIIGNQYAQKVNQLYLDLSHDLGLEQIVDFPTRHDKTLDLIFSSHPAFKVRCKPLPPLGNKSDHDIVLYDSSHQVSRNKTQRRKIYLWKRVNDNDIRSATKQFTETFISTTFQNLDHMWLDFKKGVSSILDNHVPTKMTSSKHTHPWVNTHTRRLSRRKARAYRKAKETKTKYDWDRYRILKTETQRER